MEGTRKRLYDVEHGGSVNTAATTTIQTEYKSKRRKRECNRCCIKLRIAALQKRWLPRLAIVSVFLLLLAVGALLPFWRTFLARSRRQEGRFVIISPERCFLQEAEEVKTGVNTPSLYAVKERVWMTSSVRNVELSFDDVLQRLWKSKRRLMKYEVTSVPETVPGKYRFAKQYQEGRSSKPKLLPTDSQVVQRFNPKAFNFNKASKEEILFHLFTTTEASPLSNYDSSLLLDCGVGYSSEHNSSIAPLASLFANVYPWTAFASALVVRPYQNLPQVLSMEAIEAGLYLSLLSDKGLRVGYNSLEGGASVNHLHLQTFYFDPPNFQFPVERALTKDINHRHGFFTVSILEHFPASAIVFKRDQKSSSVSPFVEQIFICVQYLLDQNIPHNLFFSPKAQRFSRFPRLASFKLLWVFFLSLDSLSRSRSSHLTLLLPG
ncbi:GDP-D-glucose phosphorylase 1 [Balamuthia mandrillaris]